MRVAGAVIGIIAGAILGGTAVAITMVLSLIGGILCLFDKRATVATTRAQPTAAEQRVAFLTSYKPASPETMQPEFPRVDRAVPARERSSR